MPTNGQSREIMEKTYGQYLVWSIQCWISSCKGWRECINAARKYGGDVKGNEKAYRNALKNKHIQEGKLAKLIQRM